MKKKLLVADDSVTIQKVVNLTFAGEDVVIEAASDGEQALEKARSLRPDIVLADVFMPGLNGYEVCAEIRKDPELAATPVVLMVGTFESYDDAEAARVQANGRLTKPFDTSELIELVRSLTSSPVAAPADKPLVAVATAAATRVKSPLVSTRSRESFLGNGAILDVFAPQMLAAVMKPEPAPEPPLPVAPPPPAPEPEPVAVQETPAPTVIQFPAVKTAETPAEGIELPDDFVKLVVDRVIRQMTPDVIREVAWEVVPELAEKVIRQVLAEKNLP